jgi:hypothetical protein
VLRWAQKHGGLWDADTCAYAIGGEHLGVRGVRSVLGVLIWLREHDCPWDERNALCRGCCGRKPECAAVGEGARLSVG